MESFGNKGALLDPQAPPEVERSGTPPQSASVCRNCGAELHGPYCASCGQQAKNLDVTVRGLMADAASTAFTLDSRIARTLRLLLGRPGSLTAEYLAGRRVRFVPPVRLYLFVSFLYFLVLAWSAAPASRLMTGEELLAEDPEVAALVDSALVAARASGRPVTLDSVLVGANIGERPQRLMEDFMARARRAAEDPARLWSSFLQGASYLMFFFVPVFGIMLRLGYPRRGYLVHHLIFSLHFHSFVFLLLLIRYLSGRVGVPETILGLMPLVIPLYLALALKKVYHGRWFTTTLKTAAFMFGYGFLLLVGMILLLLFILWTS